MSQPSSQPSFQPHQHQHQQSLSRAASNSASAHSSMQHQHGQSRQGYPQQSQQHAHPGSRQSSHQQQQMYQQRPSSLPQQTQPQQQQYQPAQSPPVPANQQHLPHQAQHPGLHHSHGQQAAAHQPSQQQQQQRYIPQQIQPQAIQHQQLPHQQHNQQQHLSQPPQPAPTSQSSQPSGSADQLTAAPAAADAAAASSGVPTASASTFTQPIPSDIDVNTYGIEILNNETFAYFPGYLLDFNATTKMLLVGYENDWKKSEWKPLASVRLAGKPFLMREFQPQAGQSVEVAAKASEQEPYSFWRSTVRTVRGEFYLISYNAVADEYTEILEKEMLRPLNQSPTFATATELQRTAIALPVELRAPDAIPPAALKDQLTEIRLTSQALAVSVDTTTNEVIVVSGNAATMRRALMLTNLAIKDLVNYARSQQRQQQQQHRVSLTSQQSFTIDPTLLGTMIGKGGKNIKAAEAVPGVTSIKVDSNSVTIYGESEAAIVTARELLEFVQQPFAVPAEYFGKFVGKQFESIREVEHECEVRIARHGAPTSRRKPTANGKSADDVSAGVKDMSVSKDSAGVEFVLTGTKGKVQDAILALQQHLKRIQQYDINAEVEPYRRQSEQGSGGRPYANQREYPTLAEAMRVKTVRAKTAGDAAAKTDSKPEATVATTDADGTSSRGRGRGGRGGAAVRGAERGRGERRAGRGRGREGQTASDDAAEQSTTEPSTRGERGARRATRGGERGRGSARRGKTASTDDVVESKELEVDPLEQLAAGRRTAVSDNEEDDDAAAGRTQKEGTKARRGRGRGGRIRAAKDGQPAAAATTDNTSKPTEESKEVDPASSTSTPTTEKPAAKQRQPRPAKKFVAKAAATAGSNGNGAEAPAAKPQASETPAAAPAETATST